VSDDRITPRHADELARCFTAHARELFGYACALARGDWALAEDLVQATFEATSRAWQAVGSLAEEQLRGWLRGTLADIAASGFRGEAAFGDRMAHVEARDHIQARDHVEARDQKASDDPADPVFSSIALDRCWQIIREMPELQHAAAMLRWQLGMKEAEIAAMLGVAEKTVTAQLERARHKLIGQLGPDHPVNRDDPEGASS
jgi:RNA polymerase sigma-70 factor, ECF subfamily